MISVLYRYTGHYPLLFCTEGHKNKRRLLATHAGDNINSTWSDKNEMIRTMRNIAQ